MVIPSAMVIEMGVDVLKNSTSEKVLEGQHVELHTAVGDRATEEFQAGYDLGLATVRAMLAMNPKVAMAGLTDEIL